METGENKSLEILEDGSETIRIGLVFVMGRCSNTNFIGNSIG